MRTNPEPRFPFEIAVNGGIDECRHLTANEFYADAHPVGERRNYGTMQDCTLFQRTALETELLQPGPPTLELIDAPDRLPYLRR